jgi:broad specificity phosphatase PhoE
MSTHKAFCNQPTPRKKETMAKIVHCIRHGQSTFNAHWAETGEDPLHPDAPLTELGRRQAAERALELRQYSYELVVTSPLTRAIQTTLGLFADHPAAPPIHVECLHREFLESSCDIGRSPSLLAQDFPHLSFGHLDDIWWHNEGEPDHRGILIEPRETLSQRVQRFREWLSLRPERLIAVVGHGTFFYHLTGRQLQNCEVAPLEL